MNHETMDFSETEALSDGLLLDERWQEPSRIIGYKVVGVFMSHDKTIIRFDVDAGGTILSEFYRAYGDCCSRGWFEHAEGVSAFLIGGIIKHIIPGPDVPYSQKNVLTTKKYNFRIITDRGLCILEMRNEHHHSAYGSFIERIDFAVADVKIIDDF